MMKMTFAMVARSLFGAKLKDEDIDLVSHTICTVQEFIVRQTIQPYLNPWFAVSGDLRKHEAMRTRADGVLMEYIKQRRHQEPGQDLLQTLMDARYSDGEGMSDEMVLSESMQLLVAGHETSSNSLSWILYLLSSRPGLPRTKVTAGVRLRPRRRAAEPRTTFPSSSSPRRSFRRGSASTLRSG
jgi:cytochrome P450